MTTFDNSAVRAEFAVVNSMVYFDNAYQTPLAASIRLALHKFYDEGYEAAGPKALWLRRTEEVRARLARFVGANASDIAFTKNTSEGLNIAASSLPFEPGDNMLLIEGDHPNNVYPWLNQRHRGLDARLVPLRSASADADTFVPHIDDRTRAISLSHVTAHAGQRHDLEGIARMCADKGIALVVDAMQSVGAMPLDCAALGTSMVCAGCHKGLLTPHGLGFLYRSPSLADLRPTYIGVRAIADAPAELSGRPGTSNLIDSASRFEIGNLNYAAIHALDAALALLERIGAPVVTEHLLSLGDHLLSHLDRLGISLIGPRERQHRSHLFAVDLRADEWVEYLADHNVRVSPTRGGIRISFGIINTVAEIDEFASILEARLTERSSFNVSR